MRLAAESASMEESQRGDAGYVICTSRNVIEMPWKVIRWHSRASRHRDGLLFVQLETPTFILGITEHGKLGLVMVMVDSTEKCLSPAHYPHACSVFIPISFCQASSTAMIFPLSPQHL